MSVILKLSFPILFLKANTPEMIKKIHKVVLEDRRIRAREIAEAIGVSSEQVHNILHEDLGIKKLCARWVLCSLALEQKLCQKDISADNLKLFNCYSVEFLCRFIPTDEAWVHHYTPEFIEPTRQWIEKGHSAPKKVKVLCPSTRSWLLFLGTCME